MKNFIKLISICAAIGAACAAVFFFRDEIIDFIKKIINKLSDLKDGKLHFGRCGCEWDDFDNFDDVDG